MPAWARVAFSVKGVIVLNAMVDMPRLADEGLPADLAHVSSGLVAIISSYVVGIRTRNPEDFQKIIDTLRNSISLPR